MSYLVARNPYNQYTPANIKDKVIDILLDYSPTLTFKYVSALSFCQ